MPVVGRIPSSVTVDEQTASVLGFGCCVGLGKGVGRREPFPSLEEVTAHPSATFRRGGEQWGFGGRQLLPKLPRESHTTANTNGTEVGQRATCHHRK